MARKKRKPTKPRKKRSSAKRGRPKKQKNQTISPKVMKSIGALIFYLMAILVLLSFFGSQGLLLHSIKRMIAALFGWGVIFLPVLFIFAGNILFKPAWRISRPTLLLGGVILFLSSISLTKAGNLGQEFWQSVSILISGLGAFLLFFIGIIIGFMVLWEMSLVDITKPIFTMIKALFAREEKDPDDPFEKKVEEKEEEIDWEKEKKILAQEPQVPVKINKKMDPQQVSELEEKAIETAETYKDWKLPSITLLSANKQQKANRGDVKQNAQIIEDTLVSFGVKAKVVDYNPGPTVTQYALRLSTGTKLTKITSLANDLALALAARTGQIRIEAPIPGRSLVGIEVPNVSSAIVTLKDLLTSPVMKEDKDKLLVGLGLDVSGEKIALDIAKMPHLLIAGQTGSGKSVCINGILMSIVFRASPSEVKLILVDPKRVELSGYNGVPHLLTPVIVEPEKVVSALKWALVEMDNRYKLLAEVGARNISAYNEMSGFTAMPYIVIVVDELADVMLFAPSEVEDCINRIAQMARAVGIHLVLATQRPSVDVITGLIKANIPARIAFNVSSMMDSRVILDTPGAEKLLGKGDMLYMPPDQAKPKRLQGAFVEDHDTKKVIDYLKKSGIPVKYTEEVTDKYKSGKIKNGKPTTESEDVDEFFDEAIKIVCQHNKASASLLQRKLSIGYNRAARIIDQLQSAGIISAPNGAKPRELLIKSYDEYMANKEQQ